jgi:hypothetical protein
MAYKKFANVKLGECEHCGATINRHDSFVIKELMFPTIRKQYLCHNPRDAVSCFTEYEQD